MPKFTLLSREESGKESCHWSVMCRLSLSVCISVSQKRRDDSGCQCFNLRLVMMKSGHTTQIFCFLSIPVDFQLQISLFIFVFSVFVSSFSWGSLFSFGFVWIYIWKISHFWSCSLEIHMALELSRRFWSALIFEPISLVSIRFKIHLKILCFGAKVQKLQRPDLKRCTFTSNFMFDGNTVNL